MPKHPDKKKERAFIMKHTTAAERSAITQRSQTSPGQRGLERRADRAAGGQARKLASQALNRPAEAAHMGMLSRARRNAKKKS